MSTPDERLRLHRWRVHASSFLVVVFTQVSLALYLYTFQPDLTPSRTKRYLKRYEQEKRQPNHETIGPHTIWTRIDLLTNDPSKRDLEAIEMKRIKMDLQVELDKASAAGKFANLRWRALETFETIR